MLARIDKLWCPECGRFIGLVRSGIEFPEPDAACCCQEVAWARKLAEPRRRRPGGISGPGVRRLRADGDWTGW